MNTLFLEYEEETSDLFDSENCDDDFMGNYGETVEFEPIKLTINPRLTSLYLDLETDPDIYGDNVYLVIVRFDNPQLPRFQDWAVVGVFNNGEEAEIVSEEVELGELHGLWDSGSNQVLWAEVYEMVVER